MSTLTVSEATDRGRHRGRRRGVTPAGALTVVLVVAGLAAGGAVVAQRQGVDLGALIGDVRREPVRRPAAAVPPVPTRAEAPVPLGSAAAPAPAALRYPQRGTGTWRTATAQGAVAGRDGQLLRYRVAVEGGIDAVDPERFGREVAVVLADRRGWTADGRWRLQRVGADSPADFTVLLTTPVTRGELCGDPCGPVHLLPQRRPGRDQRGALGTGRTGLPRRPRHLPVVRAEPQGGAPAGPGSRAVPGSGRAGAGDAAADPRPARLPAERLADGGWHPVHRPRRRIRRPDPGRRLTPPPSPSPSAPAPSSSAPAPEPERAGPEPSGARPTSTGQG